MKEGEQGTIQTVYGFTNPHSLKKKYTDSPIHFSLTLQTVYGLSNPCLYNKQIYGLTNPYFTRTTKILRTYQYKFL